MSRACDNLEKVSRGTLFAGMPERHSQVAQAAVATVVEPPPADNSTEEYSNNARQHSGSWCTTSERSRQGEALWAVHHALCKSEGKPYREPGYLSNAVEGPSSVQTDSSSCTAVRPSAVPFRTLVAAESALVVAPREAVVTFPPYAAAQLLHRSRSGMSGRHRCCRQTQQGSQRGGAGGAGAGRSVWVAGTRACPWQPPPRQSFARARESDGKTLL